MRVPLPLSSMSSSPVPSSHHGPELPCAALALSARCSGDSWLAGLTAAPSDPWPTPRWADGRAGKALVGARWGPLLQAEGCGPG